MTPPLWMHARLEFSSSHNTDFISPRLGEIFQRLGECYSQHLKSSDRPAVAQRLFQQKNIVSSRWISKYYDCNELRISHFGLLRNTTIVCIFAASTNSFSQRALRDISALLPTLLHFRWIYRKLVCKPLCIQETGIFCVYQPGHSKRAQRSFASEIAHEGFYFTTLLIFFYLRAHISLAFTAQCTSKQNHLFKVALKSSYWQKGHHINHKIFLTLSWITLHEEENDDTIL